MHTCAELPNITIRELESEIITLAPIVLEKNTLDILDDITITL